MSTFTEVAAPVVPTVPPAPAVLTWTAFEGQKNAEIAVGKDTGNRYEITPLPAGHFKLSVDGKQIGKKGGRDSLKKAAQEMESGLQTAAPVRPEAPPVAPAEVNGKTSLGSMAQEAAEDAAELAEIVRLGREALAAKKAATAPAEPVQEAPAPVEAPKPTVDLKTWTEEARKLSPQSPVAADVPKTDLPAASGIETTPGEDVLIVRLAENADNSGEVTGPSWVSDLLQTPAEGFTLSRMDSKGLVEMQSPDDAPDQMYVYLTEKGVARYDDIVIEREIAAQSAPETKKKAPPAAPPKSATVQVAAEPVAAKVQKSEPVVKKLVALSTLPLGTVFTFPPPCSPNEVGRLLKCNSCEAKVEHYRDGTMKLGFYSPGAEVYRGGELPKGALPFTIGKPVKNAELKPIQDTPVPVTKLPAAEPGQRKKVRVVVAEPKAKAAPVVVAPDLTKTVHGIPVTIKPAGEDGKQRVKLFGIAVTGILRWMGADAWTFDEARTVLKKLGLAIGEQTITSQIYSGRMGAEGKRGEVPTLTRQQEKLLESLQD